MQTGIAVRALQTVAFRATRVEGRKTRSIDGAPGLRGEIGAPSKQIWFERSLKDFRDWITDLQNVEAQSKAGRPGEFGENPS
jgi:hypothetical protein